MIIVYVAAGVNTMRFVVSSFSGKMARFSVLAQFHVDYVILAISIALQWVAVSAYLFSKGILQTCNIFVL